MPQLKTDIVVSALMRRAASAGAFSAILRKGDKDAGAYLLITRQVTKGEVIYTLYRPIRNIDGAPVWWPKNGLDQAAIDTYVNRRIDEDPDLWVVEIEDRKGRHFLIEPVEDDANLANAPKDSDPDMALKAAIKAVFPDR